VPEELLKPWTQSCLCLVFVLQARNKAETRRREKEEEEEEQELMRQKLMEEDLLFDKYTKVRAMHPVLLRHETSEHCHPSWTCLAYYVV
jgi:hypothetical protein